MISTRGKQHIKRYLAHQVGDIARSVSIGVGGLAENVAHTALQFEMGRSDIILVSYDYVNDKIVFKATLPQEMSGKIYEVAIWSQNQSTSAGEFTSKLLSSFD